MSATQKRLRIPLHELLSPLQCLRLPAPAAWRQQVLQPLRVALVRHRHLLDRRLRRHLARHLAEQNLHDDGHHRRLHRTAHSGARRGSANRRRDFAAHAQMRVNPGFVLQRPENSRWLNLLLPPNLKARLALSGTACHFKVDLKPGYTGI